MTDERDRQMKTACVRACVRAFLCSLIWFSFTRMKEIKRNCDDCTIYLVGPTDCAFCVCVCDESYVLRKSLMKERKDYSYTSRTESKSLATTSNFFFFLTFLKKKKKSPSPFFPPPPKKKTTWDLARKNKIKNKMWTSLKTKTFPSILFTYYSFFLSYKSIVQYTDVDLTRFITEKEKKKRKGFFIFIFIFNFF